MGSAVVGLRHTCAVINGAKSAPATSTYFFVQFTTTLVFCDGIRRQQNETVHLISYELM